MGAIFFSCKAEEQPSRLNINDLKIIDGQYYYAGQALDGSISFILKEKPELVFSKMSFQQGELNGEQRKFSEQGLLIEVENYALGVKDKLQRAWHANGNKRYLKNFKDGHQHGDQWEWAPEGWLADYKKYEHGKLLIHKIWRNNKKIYANYTIRDRSFVGKGGEKLCRKVTAEEGGKYVEVK